MSSINPFLLIQIAQRGGKYSQTEDNIHTIKGKVYKMDAVSGISKIQPKSVFTSLVSNTL